MKKLLMTFGFLALLSGTARAGVVLSTSNPPGPAFISATGFQSFQGTLTGSYTVQSFSETAPAGTTGAFIQFLEAGSANAGDAGTTEIDNVTLGSPSVPEPASLAMLGLGASMLLARRRKA